MNISVSNATAVWDGINWAVRVGAVDVATRDVVARAVWSTVDDNVLNPRRALGDVMFRFWNFDLEIEETST